MRLHSGACSIVAFFNLVLRSLGSFEKILEGGRSAIYSSIEAFSSSASDFLGAAKYSACWFHDAGPQALSANANVSRATLILGNFISFIDFRLGK